MKTELEIVEQVVNPGRQIKVIKYPLRNYHIFNVAEQLAYLIFGIMESDSGNSNAQNSARETRNFWNGWGLIMAEWGHAKLFRDSPWAVMEYEHFVLLPHVNEIKQLGNIKSRRVVYALQHLCRILIGLDSSAMQTWVGPGDIQAATESIGHAELVFKEYWGTGSGSPDDGFDTGIIAPEYAFGELIPDVDLNAGVVYEPSTEQPTKPFPDAPDLPSLAPAPGTTQR